MSGDYETLEINQPNITYFQKRSENNKEWLDELINKIEDIKMTCPNMLNDRKELQDLGKFIKGNS